MGTISGISSSVPPHHSNLPSVPTTPQESDTEIREIGVEVVQEDEA